MSEPNEKQAKIEKASAASCSSSTSNVVQYQSHNPLDDRLLATSPGTVRKKHRLGDERICKVCGDKAVAHNFNVISCESCKTFFRRNANKTQKECAFEGNCEITVQTRRFCPPCRLKKCFNVGMRADMILDEGERKARMEKIVTNRKKRQEATKKDSSVCAPVICDTNTPRIEQNHNVSSVCFPDSCSDSGLVAPERNLDAVDTLLSELVEYETQQNSCCQASSSSCAPLPSRSRTDSTASSNGSCVSTETGQDNNTRCKIFEHVPHSLLPSDPMMYWRLTTEEHKLITDLTVAYKETLLKLPNSEDALAVKLENMSLEKTMTYCDRFSLEVINFLKRLPDFKTLNIQDQQSVLKAGAMISLMLKSSASFSEERDAWLKDFGALPVDVFAQMTQNEYVINRYADFCRSLKRILKNDYSAYVLLSCAELFDPQAPNVQDRQRVNILKEKYTTLLKHYLESQFSYVFAGQYYDALMDNISRGKVVGVELNQMFASMKTFMQPLMQEILGIR